MTMRVQMSGHVEWMTDVVGGLSGHGNMWRWGDPDVSSTRCNTMQPVLRMHPQSTLQAVARKYGASAESWSVVLMLMPMSPLLHRLGGPGVIMVRELAGMGAGGPHGEQFLFGEFSRDTMGNGLRWVLP